MNYGLLFKELTANNVRYLICGGLATNLYGLQRMTADIDLILDLNESNINAFHSVMQKIGYQPTLPINIVELADKEKLTYYKEEKNLIAYSYFNLKRTLVPVDVITEFPYHFLEMWNRKRIEKEMGFDMYIIELNDLIEMKTRAGRDQDLTDVIYLKKIRDEKE
jgi:hypothetical protein